MQIVDFKGKKWIIDLEWEIIPDEKTIKQESKEIANKTNCNYGILVEYDQQFAIGLAKKNSKVPSAALYLALANQELRSENAEMDNYPDWIVVEDVGDDKYWMAVIKNGIPSPQYDSIFDITTVKDKITELLINDTYMVYSPCGEISSIFEGMKYIEPKNLNELTKDVTTKISFTKLRGIPNAVVYGGIALMVIFGVGLGLSSLIEGHNLKEKALALQAQQEEEARRAESEYQAKLKIYENTRAEMRQQAINGVMLGLAGDPNKILTAWYDSVGGIETGTHGWTLDTITCDFSAIVGKSMCNLNFKRTGLSTNRMLLQDYPDAQISGDTAVVSRNVNTTEKLDNKPSVETLEKLPNSKDWGFDMISQLQLLKIADINHEVKPSSDITFVPPPKPMSPTDIATGKKQLPPAPESIGIAQGEITITSDNFDLLREVADNVDFNAVGIKGVSFKLAELGKISWTVTLNYYIKTATGAIGGSNSANLSTNSLGTPAAASDAAAASVPLGGAGPGFKPVPLTPEQIQALQQQHPPLNNSR